MNEYAATALGNTLSQEFLWEKEKSYRSPKTKQYSSEDMVAEPGIFYP